ncbi:MAG: DNA gyrase subunit A [Alphaproteobacteria bacterium]|nr:DNA gyrase subunit A [Alphaproteobacteria bacterium]
MDPFAKSVVPILIQDEMRSSYMDYSMSVIIGRALPDVRDGLKPVHRRILYSMWEQNLRHDRGYKKCAKVVGEVLGKYHPHGDSAVYDALARLAQPWNLRYMLVDGQGNFGSVDGDRPAAYRYTECRMTAVAAELLTDIEKETVDFADNFDGQEREPVVLPSRFPSLLVNGAEGIAVGMATKIPPHNLREVTDACIALIDDPDLTIDDLMQYVPAPDFPTAGTIHGRMGVRDAYATGRGRVVIRGNAFFEEVNGRDAIIIDELPYQVNKARLVTAIADLVREKKLEGVAALRDESDRQGMRVVIELKKDAFPEVVLNHLYKHTDLQSTFGVILLAIVNNRPRVLTLKEMLEHYLSHRREVLLRRTRHELLKARERAHILEGFLRALDLIDEIITLIRASADVASAREGLVTRFGFSEVQAQAILDMRLQRLTGMERQKILDEHTELLARIAELEAILGSESRLMSVVKEELIEVRDRFGDVRRTRIEDATGELSMQDLVAEEDQVVTLSHAGYIKRCRTDEWRMQHRGGFGKRGMSTRDEDFVSTLMLANTHSLLLVFTDDGLVLPLHVYDVPETSRDGRGRPIVNLVPIPDGQRVTAVVSVKDLDDEDTTLLFVTTQGFVKRTPLTAFRNLRTGGMRATTLEDGDELLAVRVMRGDEGHVMLFTRQGMCIRFALDEVNLYGRTARGTYGIRLDEGDILVDAVLAPEADTVDGEGEGDEVVDDSTMDDAEAETYESTLLTVSENGYGCRIPFDRYRVQGRYGKGILSFKISDKTGEVASATEVSPDDQLMLVTDSGRVIRISARSIRLFRGRPVQGVRLMRLDEGEKIVDLERLAEVDEDEDAAEVEGEGSEDGATAEE